MSKQLALKIMFVILSIVLVFHFLILFQIIPYDIVWAGKLNSVKEMQQFEITSILINLFMFVVLILKKRQLDKGKRSLPTNILIWLFVVFFSLNTLGNLFAEKMIELILGTLLTLSSAVLCFMIVRKAKEN